MATLLSVTPIASGMLDEWRALHTELLGPRRVEWAQSQRRRGVTRQVVSLVGSEGRFFQALFTEAIDPAGAAQELRSSSDPFDVWLVERLDAVLADPLRSEAVADTAPRPGPWRGWRRWPR